MELKKQVESNGIVVISPVGKLNMVHAPLLRDSVAKLVADLSKVDFLDSSGLGALIGSLKLARQAGGDVRIVAPNEQVQLVLKLTNMDRIFTSYPTSESAFQND
jgi:anti-sigma B factor antagonist